MAILRSHLNVLAGIPTQELLEQASTLVLEPMLPFGIRVYEGPILSNKTKLAPLHEHITERPNFKARGRKSFEAIFNWEKLSRPLLPLTGSITTFIKLEAVDVELMLDSLIKTSQLLEAPFAYLDVLENYFRLRRNHHRDIYQEGKLGIDRVFGDFRGFSGIPWKTVLGPVYVDYFGVDKLRKLPPTLATEIAEDYWLLTPCKDHQDWKSDVWCEGEKEIITMLGIESFFNPQTKEVAKKAPLIPECSSLPIKIQTMSGENSELEWVYLNGYPNPE